MKKLLRSICALLAACALTGLAAAQTSVSVSGVITYTDRVFGFNGFTSTVNLPARFANVELINNANQPVGTPGFTSATGTYSLTASVPFNTSLRVRCTPNSSNAATAPGNSTILPVIVTSAATPADNYPLISTQFFANGSSYSRNMNAPQRNFPNFPVTLTGNEFNILDMALRGFEYVLGPIHSATPPPTGTVIPYRWPAAQSQATFTGSQLNVLVDIDMDDGYDDTVILHETGHVVHFFYATFTSVVANHTFGESDQDPRLAFAEGWATYFSAAVRRSMGVADPGIYVDTNVSAINTPIIDLKARLENALPFNATLPNATGINTTGGDADELAIAAILWDMIDTGTGDDDVLSAATIPGLAQSGEQLVFTTLRTVLNNPGFLSPNRVNLGDMWNGLAPQLSPSTYNLMATVFGNWKASYKLDASEPNNTPNQAASLTLGSFTGPQTLFYATNGVSPGVQDFDWYTFPVIAGSTFEIETRYPAYANNVLTPDAETMADPMLVLWDPNQNPITLVDGGGAGRNAKLVHTPTMSGNYFVAVAQSQVFPAFLQRPYGRYELRVKFNFTNTPPMVTTPASATPQAVGVGVNSTLNAVANDPQGVTYTWTPLQGGSIVGSGATVQFVPPSPSVKTTYQIELTISDALGAQVLPHPILSVEVLPWGWLEHVGATTNGQTLTMRMGGPVGSSWSMFVANDAVAPYAVPPWVGYVELDPQLITPVLEYATIPSTGIGIFSAPIPAGPALIGQDFFFQAFYQYSPNLYISRMDSILIN